MNCPTIGPLKEQLLLSPKLKLKVKYPKLIGYVVDTNVILYVADMAGLTKIDASFHRAWLIIRVIHVLCL